MIWVFLNEEKAGRKPKLQGVNHARSRTHLKPFQGGILIRSRRPGSSTSRYINFRFSKDTIFIIK